MFQNKHFSLQYFWHVQSGALKYAFSFWSSELKSWIKGKGRERFIAIESRVTLACGFKMVSRLCSLAFLYAPCFLLDLKPGLKPSTKFITINQISTILCMLFAISLVNYFYMPMFNSVVSNSDPESTKLLSFFTRVTLLGYGLFGLSSLVYFVYKRDFVYDFVLHQCANITVAADFQRYRAASLFLEISTLTILSEPVFLLFTAMEVFKQPEFQPARTTTEFFLIKQTVIWASFILTCSTSCLQNVIPICTQFLISMFETHARELMDKHQTRIKSNKTHTNDRSALVDLLSVKSLKFLDEISCSSICRDWPEVPTHILMEAPESTDETEDFTVICWKNLEEHSLTVGSRIFLYKNLIKSLIELKELIRMWESVFGIFHLSCVCLTGFLVAQWVVIVGQARIHEASIPNTPIFYRTLMSLLFFTISNILVFTKCDLLPQRMFKIRQKLLKLNLDLVHTDTEQPLGYGLRASATQQEVKLVWSLFDQADRVIKGLNFRFTGKTFYSKRCLITIFSREASLILLYMQVVDIYSTT